ncbi:MAG: aldehyde dehydrogenase family protein [Hydrococcus sp. Prado102]|nr:aldehyde dehydrogenase family protein [Hydrococcus sp. Prado102]
MVIPKLIPNWIDAQEQMVATSEKFPKLDPATGKLLCEVVRSKAADVEKAVQSSKKAQSAWAEVPPVQRGLMLHEIVLGMKNRQKEIAEIVAAETGKSYKDAYGETGGAIALGLFYASEGQRLYGRTTTSGTPNKYAMTVRMPLGVAGLIIAANTPIANVAWKVFPALICGNSAVLKAAENTPATAWIFGEIAKEAGLPPGVLNIIQGYGEEAGAPLVAHPDVAVVSFTGSTEVGRIIQRVAGERFARVSLELGGKNPLVVCDDADLDNAVKWTLLSAFSNAGQRCASGSRIIIFEEVYEAFRDRLVEKTKQLKIGTADDDDLGPIINESQLQNMIAAVAKAKAAGATILIGGDRFSSPGFYMAPTLLENVDPQAEISQCELFGPIAILYRVKDFEEALALANDSPYGLTASIHTRSLHRAVRFCDKVRSGVVVVNAGTYGSEPHMPFGGLKQSGNGTREPGTEALDVYSELKDVYINIDPSQL